MNRFLVRWSALACTAVGLALSSGGVLAQASITLNDPNCLSFTLTGTAPNQVLTCVQSTTPLCSISGPTTGTIGTALALTANCVPAANSYAWGGANNCAQTTNKVCNDPGTAYTNGQVVNYTVTGTNGSGPGPAGALSVTWSTSAPAGPSGCSITQAPQGTLPVGGGQVTLTASCTGGTGISWSWSGGFAQNATTAQVSGSVTSTTTFTATATNGGGQASPSITVQVATGGGGGGGGISCAGFNNTIVLQENWANPVRVFTGAFGPNDAVVIEFTTGALSAPGKTAGITGAEYGSPPSERIFALSATPCDFVGLANGASDTVLLNYSVGSNSSGVPALSTGTPYYINIENAPGATSCAATGVCNMFFDFSKPRGT